MSPDMRFDPSRWHWSLDRVLVATDGSAASLGAVGWAARIVEDIPAELVTAYAYEVENDTGIPSEDEAAGARARLERWCAAHGASGFAMRCVAVAGDPRTVLRDMIGRENPDLVVVGKRGGGGFPGLVVGSVTEWLAQVATVPLAVVADVGARRSGGPILAGIDGSDRSRRALEWALGLAGRLRHPVHAVYAAPWDTSSPGNRHVTAVRDLLDRVRPAAHALDVPLDLRISNDHPVRALGALAEEMQAEAIVVGARGRGAFGEPSIGRVPRQLLPVASRPVIIVTDGS